MKPDSNPTKKYRFFFVLLAAILLHFRASGQEVDTKQAINSRLMVIPADDLLKRLNCLSQKTVQGQTVIERNYQKAFTDLIELRFVIAAIAKKFSDRAPGLQLEDLEQTLKNMQDEAVDNEVRDLQNDALSMVLNRVRPDIIFELSYQLNKGAVTNSLTFLLVAKDSYTSKILTSVTNPGMETTDNNVAALLAGQVEINMNNFLTSLRNHAVDIEKNGRTIKLTVALAPGADFDLEDDCGSTGEQYIETIQAIVNKHKKANSETPNLIGNTSGKRLQITNIRVDVIDPVKKRGLSARDWVNYIRTDLQKMCGVKVKNISQGLGDGRITLSR